MANIQNIMDVIRANASAEYQERVPLATQNSITAVGAPILEYHSVQNEFLSALVNRIALTVVINKTASNPLAVLKKGTVPLGSDIQEIFTNLAKDNAYDGSGSKLLTSTTPDVKALYHRLNRQGQYAATIKRAQLQTAFTSYGELESLLTSIINSMYSGDNYDEFILMKNLMADAVKAGEIITADVSHVKDEATGKAFIKAITKASKGMTFPSSAFNSYYANRPAGATGDPIITWTPLADQILVIRADIMAEISIDVLAAAFNMDKVSFMASSMEVDSFGDASDVYAILMDRSWVQVYDNLMETTNFYNAQGLFWNYWLNHWQTISYSLFANAVAFICPDETISLNKTSMNFTALTPTQTAVATVTPLNAPVTWLTSDKKVATVADGVVTPVANGTTVITAVNGDSVKSFIVTVALA